mmetsp:Transcript_9880/g.24333  ORF Transcript_9880/g.24333 Transcript_9880/m.24333 type:complete len:303 (-) Transcript_9880:27-935(-)
MGSSPRAAVLSVLLAGTMFPRHRSLCLQNGRGGSPALPAAGRAGKGFFPAQAREEDADRVLSYRKKPQGVLTPSQRRALRELWPHYGISAGYSDTITAESLRHVFGRSESEDRYTIMEIGFGTGEATARNAYLRPDIDILAVEVHKPGLASLLKRVEANAIPNVRLIRSDAITLLADRMKGRLLDEIWILFPDPWSDASRNNRRLVRPFFLSTISKRLRVGGLLRVASDCVEYIDHTDRTVKAWNEDPGNDDIHQGRNKWEPLQKDFRDEAKEVPSHRAVTVYESKALNSGGAVWERVYRLL